MEPFRVGSINRSLSLLILVVILPSMAILLYTGIEQRRSSIEGAKEDVFLLTHTMAEVQLDLSRSVRQTLSTLALLPEIQNLNVQASQTILKAVLKNNPEYLNISLTDISGEVLTAVKPYKNGINLTDRKHIKEAIKNRKFATGEYVLKRMGEVVPAFGYAYPVFVEENTLVAILTTVVKLDHLPNFHDTLKLPEKSFIAVTDHKGIRLFYYPAAKNTNPIGKPIKSSAWKNAEEKKQFDQFTGVGSDGIRRILAFEHVRLSPDSPPYMTVWAGIPEETILAPANSVLRRNLLLLLLSTLSSLFLFWLIGKKILINPIAQLVNLTQQYGEGNLKAHIGQSVGLQEIDRLKEAFHDMAVLLESNQNTLVKSEEKFRAFVNQATDGIIILDADANIIFVNNQTCENLGYSETELMNLSVRDIDTIFNQRTDKDGLWEKIHSGKKQVIESEHRRKNGSTFPVEIHIGLIEVDGKSSILSIVRDITARLEFEKSLQQSKEEWESTFDAMGDIITIQDKDMRIIRGNKAFHDFFQIEYGELNGKYCFEVFRGRNKPCSNCPGFSILKNRKPRNAEIVYENLQRIFQVSGYPILDDGGALRHLVHIARDITDQKRIQEELFQSHKMEAIGTLAGGIAHDFNNILSAILGYAGFVKSALPDNSSAHEDIDRVIQAGKRAANLVKQILTFSRKQEHQYQTLTPHLIVDEALQMIRSSLPATIKIKEYIDKDCGNILADPTNIHQIIVNLSTNALHAMDQQKGTLTIRLYREDLLPIDVETEPNVTAGSFIVISVSDDGCGMDEDTLNKIFEPYFTTKDVGKGSGIGLSVLHGIVQDGKGFIRVNSAPDKGSTFAVYLPMVQKDSPAVTDMQEMVQTYDSCRGRILVVDDEEIIVIMNKRRLEFAGYKVTAETNSETALETFRTHPDQFDLLITDQTMPNITGAELTKEMLKIKPGLPVIMSTGHSGIVSEQMALELGITKYIPKPIQDDELILTVEEIFSQQQS